MTKDAYFDAAFSNYQMVTMDTFLAVWICLSDTLAFPIAIGIFMEQKAGD